MFVTEKEWTDAELQQAGSLYVQAWSVAQIAKRLGRDETSVADQISIVKERAGPLPAAEPNEWPGPDEEGEVIPRTIPALGTTLTGNRDARSF